MLFQFICLLPSISCSSLITDDFFLNSHSSDSVLSQSVKPPQIHILVSYNPVKYNFHVFISNSSPFSPYPPSIHWGFSAFSALVHQTSSTSSSPALGSRSDLNPHLCLLAQLSHPKDSSSEDPLLVLLFPQSLTQFQLLPPLP